MHAPSYASSFILHLSSLDERKALIPWWLHCQRGRRNGLKCYKGRFLEKLRKMQFLKYDDHSEGEHLICILVFSLSFLNLNCNSWILTMIEGHFEQLFFLMDLKWDFDSFRENEAFLLSFVLSHLCMLFWSQLGHFLCFLLHLDQVVHLRENCE